MLIKRYSKTAIFVFVGIPLLCGDESNYYLNKAKSIAASAAAGWATVLGSVISHEVGHVAVGKALAPKAVKGGAIGIQLSGGRPAGNFTLSFEPRAWNSMNPGYKRFWLFNTYAAGPLAGLSATYAALQLSNIFAEKKKEPEVTYMHAWKKGQSKPLLNKEQNIGVQVGALYATIQNLLAITPWSNKNDGYKMLEAVGKSRLAGAGSTKTLLASLFMGLAVAGYGGTQIYKARTADKK